MIKVLATIILALGLAGATEPPAPGENRASLTIDASDGTMTGVFVFHFAQNTRLYLPERWGLSPTANRWFRVRFESDDGTSFDLVQHGAMPKWPHPDGVREFTAGEEARVEFVVAPGSDYRLQTPDGRRLDSLPPGRYQVTARYEVPDELPVRRCALTVFSVEAPAAFLEVPPSP